MGCCCCPDNNTKRLKLRHKNFPWQQHITNKQKLYRGLSTGDGKEWGFASNDTAVLYRKGGPQ
jgi:hypothetical protein